MRVSLNTFFKCSDFNEANNNLKVSTVDSVLKLLACVETNGIMFSDFGFSGAGP